MIPTNRHPACQDRCHYEDCEPDRFCKLRIEEAHRDHVAQMQDEWHEKFRPLKRWIVVQDKDGFTVHEWTHDGIAPPSTSPTVRLAASRLLQLMRLGPVGPQDHPEEVCVGSVTMEPK